MSTTGETPISDRIYYHHLRQPNATYTWAWQLDPENGLLAYGGTKYTQDKDNWSKKGHLDTKEHFVFYGIPK